MNTKGKTYLEHGLRNKEIFNILRICNLTKKNIALTRVLVGEKDYGPQFEKVGKEKCHFA